MYLQWLWVDIIKAIANRYRNSITKRAQNMRVERIVFNNLTSMCVIRPQLLRKPHWYLHRQGWVQPLTNPCDNPEILRAGSSSPWKWGRKGEYTSITQPEAKGFIYIYILLRESLQRKENLTDTAHMLGNWNTAPCLPSWSAPNGPSENRCQAKRLSQSWRRIGSRRADKGIRMP